jgi:protocatechuate 3,4-dioxygenase beta subunit
MTKHSLRPLAISVMLASGFPLLAQQTAAPAATLVATGTSQAVAPGAGVAEQSGAQTLLPGTSKAFGLIAGNALDANGNPIPRANVRLRDTRTGKIVDSKRADDTGRFSFRGVDPGNYVVELLSDKDNVRAASRMITVNAGDSVTTLVKLPTEARSLAGFLAHQAPIAAVVIGSASAAGVLAVRSGNCVSPPCEN